jgi:hypothetical protein
MTNPRSRRKDGAVPPIWAIFSTRRFCSLGFCRMMGSGQGAPDRPIMEQSLQWTL